VSADAEQRGATPAPGAMCPRARRARSLSPSGWRTQARAALLLGARLLSFGVCAADAGHKRT
jgi:hypothetical protein